MSLALISGSGYSNPEYFANEEKDILLVWYYANEPSNQRPIKQLTFKHLAAIRRAQLIKENPKEYEKLKISPEDFEKKALILNDLIQHINYYDQEYWESISGMKINGNEKRVEYILNSLKEKFPGITESHLVEGYRLGRFLEILKGGLIYEEGYLERLKDKFAMVPDNIKQEFGLQSL